MKITQIRKVYAVQGMHCAFTDIVSFRGRYYLGFMEGPQHMVNSENCCMILSSLDGVQWETVCRVHCGKDTREPKFMELNEKVLCYFFSGRCFADDNGLVVHVVDRRLCMGRTCLLCTGRKILEACKLSWSGLLCYTSERSCARPAV